jgi:ABC-type multidrug transport system ATPase subunit
VRRLSATPDTGALYGKVEIRQVDLSFNAEGTVVAMPRHEGDHVKQGDLMAELDPATYQSAAALAEARRDAAKATLDELLAGTRPEDIDQARANFAAAKASLADAQTTFARRKDLAARNVSSQQQLDDARMAMDSAIARQAQTQAALTEAINGPRIQDIDAARRDRRAAPRLSRCGRAGRHNRTHRAWDHYRPRRSERRRQDHAAAADAGLLRPTSGSVRVLGHDMATDAAAAHPSIGYMPQRFGLYEDLTVAENLDLFADLHAMPRALRNERIARLLRFTGLVPFTARLAGKLSGGMKQELGLACALLSRPRLLLLDEPSVDVDPVSRRELWSIVTAMLAEGRDEGMAVIWATAYLDEAARCGRVLLLHQGRLLADAPPGEFLAPLQGRVFRLAIADSHRRAIARQAAQHSAVLDAQVEEDTLRLVLRANMLVPSAEALRGTVLQPLPPRFEDGFIDRLAPADPPAPPAPMPLIAGLALTLAGFTVRRVVG